MTISGDPLAQGWRLHQTGAVAAAEGIYRQVLAAQPNNAAAWCYLGIACHDQQRLDDAVAAYQRAIELDPRFPIAWNNLGNTLRLAHRDQESLAAFDQAVRLKPDYAVALRNKGAALIDMDRIPEAEMAFRQSLAIDPSDVECRRGLAGTSFYTGKNVEAIEGFRAVLKESPGNHEARKSLGLALLLQGEYAGGFPAYEARLLTNNDVGPLRHSPKWDGSPLEGRTLLLEAEQGLGDTIQFVRYAAEIKRRGHVGRIIVSCQPMLLKLLESASGIDLLVPKDQPRPSFDVWTPLLSLPGILGNTPQDVPADVPYLKAPAENIEKWRSRLAHLGGLKIGIAWQGSLTNGNDRRRSVPVTQFAALGKLYGATLVSLQKGPRREQADTLTQFEVASFGEDFDTLEGAFHETAAAMMSLDLVITVDTSVAHLAGALGKPVWVALPTVPDWRWGQTGDRTPWYPTMRLFRQTKQGEWNSVFERLAAAVIEEHPTVRPKRPAEFRLATSGFGRLARTRHGLMLYNRHDAYVGKSLELLGEFSEGENDLFRQLVRPGNTVVEAGANIGSFTVPLARLAAGGQAPGGMVHAIEPERVLFQTLCANVALNSLTNVVCHHAAAGEKAGTIFVPLLDHNQPNNFGGLRLGDYQTGERTPVIVVDGLGLTRCELLKIDVEGMELAVVKGAVQTIKRFRPLLYLEHNRYQNSPALIELLFELGYKLYWHLPPLANSANYYGNPENPFGPVVSANMLGVHSSVHANIQGLRPIESPQSDWRQ